MTIIFTCLGSQHHHTLSLFLSKCSGYYECRDVIYLYATDNCLIEWCFKDEGDCTKNCREMFPRLLQNMMESESHYVHKLPSNHGTLY